VTDTWRPGWQEVSSSTRGRELRAVIGVLGTVWALSAEAIALQAGESPAAVLLDLAIGLTYLYGGLAIWGRAPANRTGAKMTAVGLTWFLAALDGSQIPIVGDLGGALGDVSAAFLLALVLSYPGGVLETTVDRVGIAVMLVGTTTISVIAMQPGLSFLTEGGGVLYVALGLAVMASALILRRWLMAPPRTRSDLSPVLLAGAVYVVTTGVNIVRRIALVPDSTSELLVALVALAPAAVPVALLIGFYRQSERRLQALVDAIPDPIVRIGRDGRPLDAVGGTHPAQGMATRTPGERRSGEARLATEQDGTHAAVVRALDDDRLQSLDVVLDLPEGRRDLEVRLAPSGPDEVIAIVRDFTAQREAEAEIRRSRARIVEAADAERRRVERNLHDGAQQRLVALSLALRRARAQLPDDADGAAAATLEEASAQLKAALAELRELARGIHPAILTEAGLGPAIRSLAGSSPVEVALDLDLPPAMPAAVEAAAYFVVAEALTNVGKYADASRVVIRAAGGDAGLRIEVIDDGRGGADPTAGSGLRGLADRVAALGGRLEVRSRPGDGTSVIASFPPEVVAGAIV
jgi:signal transduction histidine kinase